MKCWILAGLVGVAGSVAAAPPGPTDHVDVASPSLSRHGPTRTTAAFAVGSPGDTIEDALPVGALPFLAQGSTCGLADDYDETCPFGESVSPDVVYAFVASFDGGIDVRLCESGYDTKVYVYADAWTKGSPLACDDDGCGVDGFRSELLDVPVEAGRTYYIVVDGYFGACGDYVLEVAVGVPCVPLCAPGDMVEPEAPCEHGYVDVTNGGCVSANPVFTDIPCGATGPSTWCGTYGGYIGEGTTEWRDTDWYAIDPSANDGGVVVRHRRVPHADRARGLAAGCSAPVSRSHRSSSRARPAASRCRLGIGGFRSHRRIRTHGGRVRRSLPDDARRLRVSAVGPSVHLGHSQGATPLSRAAAAFATR